MEGASQAQDHGQAIYAKIRYSVSSTFATGCCIMTCTKYQMLQNLDNLPNGVKTVKFIQAIGVFLKDLDISKKADKNKLTEMNRKGCAALGGSECAEKRLIGFFTAIVLFSVAKVGLFSKPQQAILSLPSKWWELSVILLSFMLSIFFIAFNLHPPFFPEIGDRAMTFIIVIIRATIDFQ